jgi:hypothetical protein
MPAETNIMTYKELLEIYPTKGFGVINVSRNYKAVDARANVFDPDTIVEDCGSWAFWLDHQCGAWVIGDFQMAREMMQCLEAAIKYAESNP